MQLEALNHTLVDIYLYQDPYLGYRLQVPRYYQIGSLFPAHATVPKDAVDSQKYIIKRQLSYLTVASAVSSYLIICTSIWDRVDLLVGRLDY
jgi:hypothetical protein